MKGNILCGCFCTGSTRIGQQRYVFRLGQLKDSGQL